jgi:Domain of unknown function (DUF4124)
VTRHIHRRLCVLASLSLLASAGYAQKLYRWVDESGNVHYSDRVPPDQSRQNRVLLNEQGVTVGSEQGALTDDERRALEETRLAEETARIAAEDAARRDQILLDTYLSVDDIEEIRDRWLELVESQITVTDLYLASQRQKLEALQRKRLLYAPYSERENAPPVPENLALEISRTESSIETFEQRLVDSRAEQEEIRQNFQADIVRFRELKGL